MFNPTRQNNAGLPEVPFAGYQPEKRSFFQTTRTSDRESVTNQLYATPSFPLPSFAAGQDCRNQIDSIISQNMRKLKLEFEETQKIQARLIISAGAMKLKEKDEQIQRIEKLNLILQERVNNILLENQMLRDIAQSKEATVNSLRMNLEQVLAQADREDAESCCASSDDNWRKYSSERKCRMCGDRESSVLVMPCRHLCLCGECGSGSRPLQACPVCKASIRATLNVNLTP